MKRIITSFIFLLCCMQAMPDNPEKKTIQSGEYEREYLLYVPEGYDEGKPAGLIVCLHGLDRTMNDFFNDYNIAILAENLNLIVIAPQALPEKNPDVLFTLQSISALGFDFPISLDAVWGCGLQVVAKAPIIGTILNVTLNTVVDDVTFIKQIITKTEEAYAIIPEKKFIFGTSMGGFMSYQYALYHGYGLSGLINICGSMGTDIQNSSELVKLPICDFHSVDDEVVPYTGKVNVAALIEATISKNKEEVVNFWVNKNGANTSPIVDNINYYPSTTGHSVTKYTYSGENEVIHYKLKGASHSYFFSKETDCMDYIEEIAKFITSNSKVIDSSNDLFTQQKQLIVYPNPIVGATVNLNIKQGLVLIYNLNGQKVLSAIIEDGKVNIEALQQGFYIISVTVGNETYQGKMIVR